MVMLGFSLMVLAYTLPTDIAHDNIVHDAETLYNLDQLVIPEHFTTKLDIYTDTLILSEISYYNENVSLIDNAMSVYGIRDGADFQKFIEGDDSVIDEYPRYWHGNLVVYKPLFCFVDYNAVKILELFFEMVMITAIVRLMFKNNLKNYIIPFILSLFFIHPEVIGICLQYMPMFNLMLISVYILLKFKDYLLENDRIIYYFLIVGMSAGFFDFTTYPLITFGIPTIYYMLLENDKQTLKTNVLKIILFGLIWGVGFVGMWASKWIISSIILDKNVIANALDKLLWRTSSIKFTRIDAIWANVSIYKKIEYLMIMGLIGIYYIKRLISAKQNITKDNVKNLIPFILIALTPFAWYFIVSNHSFIHCPFTYRTLLILFFAVMCSFEYIISKKKV